MVMFLLINLGFAFYCVIILASRFYLFFHLQSDASPIVAMFSFHCSTIYKVEDIKANALATLTQYKYTSPKILFTFLSEYNAVVKHANLVPY